MSPLSASSLPSSLLLLLLEVKGWNLEKRAREAEWSKHRFAAVRVFMVVEAKAKSYQRSRTRRLGYVCRGLGIGSGVG
ncbi:hypothetical protein CDL15_Pgr015006 [Punica granatum]|nr:hypothetical protein CDL15_Pgr015006 [Punica granatum]